MRPVIYFLFGAASELRVRVRVSKTGLSSHPHPPPPPRLFSHCLFPISPTTGASGEVCFEIMAFLGPNRKNLCV